ncbi:PREDICTED: uncharacterized protein LOC105116211 [Populus euphratica]|uniref:Uncharacterized protein LOC105116211 n=1 Tax=Populus euphratica TaxID=75702 RepID=A0AAJ6XAW3_POPEU|nr:PREDICTED: uncharacterized protein LOC105116211 [Populus euphratica]
MATAAVCGAKRSYFFEDEISSIPLLKRIRCTSPPGIPPPQPPPKENPVPENPVHASGEQWVDLLVKEMTSASSVDDAKSRAGRVLEMLQKVISDQVTEEAAKGFETENYALKERVEALCQENGVLKRAVMIQHEMLKEGEEKEKELKQFKEMVEHYQEKVRMLEVNNYALSVHLNQALQGNSLGGRCNPDVY